MPTKIEVVGDATAQTPSDKGFIKVRRYTLRTHDEQGSAGEPYRYDVVDRDALDAVLMVLYSPRVGHPSDPYVCVRTAQRPPVALRKGRPLPLPHESEDPMVWELPAGLIEPGAHGESALRETASRETEEETGYAVGPERFERLGAPVYLSPGLCAEKLYVLRAEVDRSKGGKPTATEAVELVSRLEWWTLSEALAKADAGVIEDCKTELALRRLRAHLAAAP